MKTFLSILCFLSGILNVLAATSFAGANNYYIYSLPESERIEILDAMKTAGMKVLRTWVSGHAAGQKGSSSSAINDLEKNGLGSYDDTILNQIDQLMVEAHDRGIKLLIGMYDQNALRGKDIYANTYGVDEFYTNSQAISDFNKRIDHILSGHNSSLHDYRSWNDLSEYIFGFEAQNEPMIWDQTLYKNNLDWICNTAQQIRKNVANPDMLVFTGGGSAAASVQSVFFSDDCPGIDVVEIHDYNDDYSSFLADAVSQAKAAGKKLIVGEWGSLYGSSRTGNLKDNVKQINAQKIPWLYWQLISNADPHEGEDYEVNGEDWSTLSEASESTLELTDAPFDFSAALAL